MEESDAEPAPKRCREDPPPTSAEDMVETELVSVIMPVHNASRYLDDAIASVESQTYRPLELVCFDDCSTDDSVSVIEGWRERLSAKNITLVLGRSALQKARGPGYGRNQAFALSSGKYLCHLDADDMMAPQRVSRQRELAILRGEQCLIGCNFNREPLDSTPYYTSWLNAMSDEDIVHQQFRECTIICPTWFMHRNVFETVKRLTNNSCGAFVEEKPGLTRVPEDTFFFMDHLEHGGTISKVHEELVTYRYAPGSWCIGTPQLDLNRARLDYVERRLILSPGWERFTVWGYGKDGRKFVTMLSKDAAERVCAFCDVDTKKVGMTYFIHSCRKHVPVIHFEDAKPPILICVASKRTGGALEENIRRLGLIEGTDYFHFS